MADNPPGSQPSGDFSNRSLSPRGNSSQAPNSSSYDDDTERRKSLQGAPQSLTQQGNYPSMQAFPSHQPQGRQEAFNMVSLGNSLPEIAYQTYGGLPAQRYSTGPSSPHQMYQVQGTPQFAGPSTMSPTNVNLPYNAQFQQHYHGMFMPGQSQPPPNIQAGLNSATMMYQGHGYVGQQQQLGPSFYMQPGQYGPQSQMYHAGAAAGQYGGRAPFVVDNQLIGKQRTEYSTGGSTNRSAGKASTSSVVRGPPRKPRQSGHAIWIGNLPPQTDLMSLVFHVCKETSGLESLFLIAKSNCAFANFKDEASCATAQLKIHDSKFQTVRLVSRLRRSSVGATADGSVPTGPAALAAPAAPSVVRSQSQEREAKPSEADSDGLEPKGEEGKAPKDKFFVVKSLTVEDLELSVRNGIWATQSHNEEALNKAYQTADNVFLIFSANKSGEYFGYARMISPINDDPAAAIEFAPTAHVVEDPELPKAIPTPATEYAPKGRIIDDSARGTIFWEAERDEEDGVDEEDDSGSNRSGQEPESSADPKAWGKPFNVEWISTTRLPFYRTRGLRNPWNSNREVKIARDGTELETAIGRRLIGLFHRLPSPTASNIQGAHIQMRPF